MVYCRKIRKDLSAYIDGELSAAESDRLERHVAGCKRCAAELDRLRETADVTADAFGEVNDWISGLSAPVSRQTDTSMASGGQADIQDAHVYRSRRSARFTGSVDLFDVTGRDGTIAIQTSLLGRMIPVILIILAVLILYSTELDATIIPDYSALCCGHWYV